MRNEYEIVGNKVHITLKRKDGNHLTTVIDLEDLPKLLEIPTTWFSQYSECTKSYYANAYESKQDGKRKRLVMHRIIIGAREGMVVDHINHDTLNNTRSNLREVTYSENGQNRTGASKHSSTGIRGVSIHKTTGLYRAVLTIDGKVTVLGHRKDIKKAEKLVKEARKKMMKFSSE